MNKNVGAVDMNPTNSLNIKQALIILHNITKMPLVYFVMLSALAGFGLGLPRQHGPMGLWLSMTIFGLMFLSMGSFALNQIQEVPMDEKMPRTQKRPLPAGLIGYPMAFFISISLLCLGIYFLYMVSPLAALIGGFTVFFYNVIYTYFLKPYWAFAAIPGAIPGALPAVTGFVAAGGDLFSSECFYIFAIIFLWQMPHYWSLAIRYKDDYALAKVPVLPVKYGNKITLYYMIKYYFAYILLAFLAPYFIYTGVFFWGLILPVSLTVSYYFYKFYRSQDIPNWRPFFHWINHSLLVFIAAPVLDKWVIF
jgi:protoheme IX farnesyltransferase